MAEPIVLTEYQTVSLLDGSLTDSLGLRLWQDYGPQVEIEFPSLKTEGKWKLTAKSWVGYIPLDSERGIELRPKIRLSNLFGMLEYAYRLHSLKFLDGMVHLGSLREFYQELARVLALRALDRGRKGFYRSYVPRSERSPYIHGRLNLKILAATPWRPDPRCDFEEHTGDVDENRILAWTFFRILRSGMCGDRVSPTVRRAYREISGVAELAPYRSHDCAELRYHRLNADYQPMHALCRFFLDQTGPSHVLGNQKMLPFLLDMNKLFELFVAEWLVAHCPGEIEVLTQHSVYIGEAEGIRFDIDLLMRNVATKAPLRVLDTKYKDHGRMDTSDISQVVAYAEAIDCREAVLVYPRALPRPLDTKVGRIRVRSLAFSVDGPLEHAGQVFLQALLEH